MVHKVPLHHYETTLTVIKVEGGIEITRTSIKSPAAVCVPQLGSVYELYDLVDGKELRGVVTKISHKNVVKKGPVFEGALEVTIT